MRLSSKKSSCRIREIAHTENALVPVSCHVGESMFIYPDNVCLKNDLASGGMDVNDMRNVGGVCEQTSVILHTHFL